MHIGGSVPCEISKENHLHCLTWRKLKEGEGVAMPDLVRETLKRAVSESLSPKP